jgi:fatty acid metabolism transcriptional regulator FadR
MPRPKNPDETAVDRAERLLVERIVNGTYPPDSYLPGERLLSKSLEIARPALREALQRLNHDGWLDIQRGKSTRVRNYLLEGTLNILTGLFKVSPDLMPELVGDMLEVWGRFAPAYAAAAVRRAPGLVIDRLESCDLTEDNPEAYADAMWGLHRTMIDYCGNRVYGLIFNSFTDFYRQLGIQYYGDPANRAKARQFWETLWKAACSGDTRRASNLMDLFMRDTLAFWRSDKHRDPGKEAQAQDRL